MKKNAILFCKIGKEDYWISGGMVFRVKSTDTYQDAYNEIKEKLESKEMVDHIIENRYLLSDYFNGDSTFSFKRTYFEQGGLYYEFENKDGQLVEYKFSADFIFLAE